MKLGKVMMSAQVEETEERLTTRTYEAEEPYVKLLGRTHNDNGVMGADLYDAMCGAAENYTAETGDENISVFRLSTQDGSTGYAADWHPTAATHDIAAAELADYINALND